jgi:[ribosomal protein S5]-alanine N-acetyltransferase
MYAGGKDVVRRPGPGPGIRSTFAGPACTIGAVTAPTGGQGPAAPAPGPVAVRFVALTHPILVALRDGDLTAASTLAGVELPEFFLGDRELWLWRLRLSDIAANPEAARWIARAAVDEPGGFVVGHAGFHGPPNDDGMVEVGYTVLPEYRRRGYARAMLAALLRQAADEPQVRVVRASISPDNAASLATIKGFGFEPAGEQWDEEDGRELLFEVPAR